MDKHLYYLDVLCNTVPVTALGVAEPRSRAERLATAVEERIRDDALQPGAPVGTIDDLCAESGFSRPTVNEATRLLRDRGLVMIKPGRGGGLFVAEPDPVVRLRHTLLSVPDDPRRIADAIELRDHLELLIALGAAERCTGRDETELRRLLTRLADAPDWEGFLRANWALHARIAAIAPNELARAVYRAALDQLARASSARQIEAEPSGYRAERQRAHIRLVDAITSGDERRVRSAVIRHNAPAGAKENK